MISPIRTGLKAGVTLVFKCGPDLPKTALRREEGQREKPAASGNAPGTTTRGWFPLLLIKAVDKSSYRVPKPHPAPSALGVSPAKSRLTAPWSSTMILVDRSTERLTKSPTVTQRAELGLPCIHSFHNC